MKFITDEQCGESLEHLAKSATEYGRLRGESDAIEHEIKIAKGVAFIQSGYSTVTAKQAHANSCDEVIKLVERLENTKSDYYTLLSITKFHELRIEVWRSLTSREGRGHV